MFISVVQNTRNLSLVCGCSMRAERLTVTDKTKYKKHTDKKSEYFQTRQFRCCVHRVVCWSERMCVRC